jgi:apolipoprotein N-acyltransferase
VPRLRLIADGTGPRVPPAAARAVAAVATGLLLAAAFPAPDLGMIALVALIPLLLAADRVRPRTAAGLGALAGLVFFGIVATWISAIGNERAAGVAAWAGLVVVQAGYLAAFTALVPASRRLGRARIPLLAAAWVAVELIRGRFPLGGFAWGQLGLTQHDGPLLPLAGVIGADGLSFVIAGINLLLAEAVVSLAGRRVRRVAVLAAVAVVPFLAGLAAPGPPAPDGPAVKVAAIQGNVPFDRSNRGLTNFAVFSRHVAMTEALAGGPRPDLVVWGEGAADDDPVANPLRAADVARAASAAGAPLLLGATTELGGGRYATEGLLFTPGGQLADRYVKRRLVPFGEYVPGGGFTRALIPATGQLPYDKRPGDRLEPLLLNGTPMGVLICYESSYAEDAAQLTRRGARFLVLLGNNASFGRSPLSAQHLASVQLRAVEQGRTIVFTTVSGRSAIVTPDGRASQTTDLYTAATILADVQPRSGLTVYGRIGRAVQALMLGLTVALLALLLLGRRRRRAPVVDLGTEGAGSGTSAPRAPAGDPDPSMPVADPPASASAPDLRARDSGSARS